MFFHFAPAANHEALVGAVQAVQRAAGNDLLPEDGDALPGHAAVTDQERCAGQSRQARTDQPSRFPVGAVWRVRTDECFILPLP